MRVGKTSLKFVREQKGLSLKQVGTILHIHPSLVNRIENNIRRPTREQLIQLANLYELNRDELLIEWLSDHIAQQLANEELAAPVLRAVEEKIANLKYS